MAMRPLQTFLVTAIVCALSACGGEVPPAEPPPPPPPDVPEAPTAPVAVEPPAGSAAS
jgi:hypothetical protein